MKYVSVCSGVEAATLAWEQLGWQPVWFSEIDPFPCEVLKQRWPNVPNMGDMTKIKIKEENGNQIFTNGNGTDVTVSGRVDLLVGGTPCQGFSIAGARKGLEDDRSNLCLAYIHLLKQMQPKWFVWENVPGVFTTNKGDDFKEFIKQVNEIGYSCSWRVLDAQYVRTQQFPRAIPQRRRRVFVIGHLGDEWETSAKVLFEPESLLRNTPPSRTKGKGFTRDSKESFGETSKDVTFSMGSFAQFNESETASVLRANGGDIGNGSENLVKLNISSSSIGNGQVCGLLNTTTELAQTLHCMHDQQAVLIEEKQNLIVVNGAETPITSIDKSLPIKGNPLENCVYGASFEINYNCPVEKELSHTLKCGTAPGTYSGVLTLGEQECYKADSGEKYPTAHLTGQHDDRVTDFTNLIVDKNLFYWHSHSVEAKPVTDDCSPTIPAAMGMGGTSMTTPILVVDNDKEKSFALAENIIGRQPNNGGNGNGFHEEVAYTQNATGVMAVATKRTVRRLTPLECERLMGFPDNHTRISWNGKSVEDCPDSHRYKACGNSMCVNVMEWIGRRIQLVEDNLI